MSLVKYEDRALAASWTTRDQHATRHKIPKDVAKPVLDYDKLKMLCSIEGLKQRQGEESSGEAHQRFMAEYKSIFVPQQKGTKFPKYLKSEHKMSITSLPSSVVTTVNSKSVAGGKSTMVPGPSTAPKLRQPSPEPSHDIRDHLPLLHKQRRNEDPQALMAARIKTLRKLLRKLPFERTAADNKRIYNAAKHFTSMSGQVAKHIFKELCVVAQLDTWKDEDITVFGNTGLHLVLRGSVRPYNTQYMKHRGVQMEFQSPTPEPTFSMPQLNVGECFGTLEKVEGRDPNSRILTVSTIDDCCEFMKISTSDYERVVEQIRSREQTEKINLMMACTTYKMWTKQPLIKVADLFTWVNFPANTVLVSEGFQAPFIAIIKSGECHILRQLEVLHQLPGGKKERQKKQVVMGKLSHGQSFGEVSVIGEEPMSCTVITATDVELACIEPPSLHTLDDVTLQLLLQSSERTYADVTQDDIHTEYIQQENKREWNEFKHNMVVDVINKKGIRPGYGKWSKDQTN